MDETLVNQIHVVRIRGGHTVWSDSGISVEPELWRASLLWSDGYVSEAEDESYDVAIENAWQHAERRPIRP